MSDDESDLEALLAAERGRPEPPPAVKTAVAARVAAVLGASAIGAGVGVAAAAGASAAAGANAAAGAKVGASVAMKVALGVLLGSVVGGTIVAATLPPRVVVQTREVRVEVPAPPPSATTSAPLTSPSATTNAPLTSPSALPSAATASARVTPPLTPSSGDSGPDPRDGDLARERSLVDRARSALARGDAAGALASADEHRKAFPRGQLAEEREVVAIQALAAAGRSEEAGTRAGTFRKAYPSSLLLPIVDAALRPR